MELWVRSQDKESLTKVSNVQYTYIEGNLYTDVREKHFIGTNNDEFQILGRYETKERALEVLSEIMLRIHQLNMFELGIIRVFDGFTTIYEMPRE